MLGNLKPQAPDKILALMGEYRADPRQGKIDLGVGVYKDADGHTPIMRAVLAAEKLMLETETTKSYAGLAGEPDFQKAMGTLILGAGYKPETTAALATVGGTGAIRQALELARMANPDLRVFVSNPTWPNHVSIMNFMGVPVAEDAAPRRAMGGDGQGVRRRAGGDQIDHGFRSLEDVADKGSYPLHRHVGAVAAFVALIRLQDRGHDFGGRAGGVVRGKAHQGVSSIR